MSGVMANVAMARVYASRTLIAQCTNSRIRRVAAYIAEMHDMTGRHRRCIVGRATPHHAGRFSCSGRT